MTTTFAEATVEQSSTTGLGTYSLNGSYLSYNRFRASYASGNAKTFYVVRNKDNTKWEFNRNATLTHGSPDTLTRGTYKSSNSDAPVNWTSDDLPLTVYVPPANEILELVVSGNAGGSRNPFLKDGAVWPDTTNTWSGRVPFKINPLGTEIEMGAYEGAAGVYLPNRNVLTATVGAANFNPNTAHAGWMLRFDNSGAARSCNLPALSSVPSGYCISVYGTSQGYLLNLVPNGSDAIDLGSAGQTLSVPGRLVVTIWKDISSGKWQTDYDYANSQTLTSNVGAANYTVTLPDLGYYIRFDNTAAARSCNLPALSAVQPGFTFTLWGISNVNVVNLVPNGTDAIDYGANGQTLPLPGKCAVRVWKDLSTGKWQTDFDYSISHTLIVSDVSAVTELAFTGLPYWVNSLYLDYLATISSSGNYIMARTYGADGVEDNAGADYAGWWFYWHAATYFPGSNNTSVMSFSQGSYSGWPINAHWEAHGIKEPKYTMFNGNVSFVDGSGTYVAGSEMRGARLENDKITGLKLYASAGTFSGKFILSGRA